MVKLQRSSEGRDTTCYLRNRDSTLLVSLLIRFVLKIVSSSTNTAISLGWVQDTSCCLATLVKNRGLSLFRRRLDFLACLASAQTSRFPMTKW